MSRRYLAPVVALALVAAAACSPSDSASGDSGYDEVSVGVIPIADVAPIYLGDAEGIFADHGIDLTLESGQGGAAIVPGVSNGDLQFGFSNFTSLMLAQNQGLDLRAVASGGSSTSTEGEDFGAVVAGEDTDIESASDLEGKTVAVNTVNNISDTTVRESIRKDGGDPAEVEFTEFAFPDMAAQLEAGNVDAAMVVEPFLTINQDAGARVVAWNYVDIGEDLTVASYFTSAEFAKDNAELVERFTAALNESSEHATDNPDAVREILTEYADIDAELAEKMTLPAWPVDINPETTARLGELGVEDGVLESEPDLDALLP